MIVCHSFFYKAHPKYLDDAINMMQSINNCCFFYHDEFESWVIKLKEKLRETTGGRFEKDDIQLQKTSGRVQIDIKHGQDYSARIDFIIVEKAISQHIISGDFYTLCKFHPNGTQEYGIYNKR